MTGVLRKDLVKDLFSKKMGICLCLGFASGMPLFVLLSLLGAYLRKEGVDLKSIGLFSLIMFPYTWKFVWAPLVDRYNPFNLGRRRGFIILSQSLVFVCIALLGVLSPKDHLFAIAAVASVLSFASATQDIAIDAYRREILEDNEQGLGNSILADFISWMQVFIITAAFMLPTLVLSLFLKEGENQNAPRTLKAAIIEPFVEFKDRQGLVSMLLIVLFVFSYKLGDSMATALATPFYIDIGYSMTTIGLVAKNAGLWAMIIGGILGGIIMLKIGINRALWLFGFGQLVTILGFYALAYEHTVLNAAPPVWLFALVVVAEFLGAGLGTAAFVAFIASKTNKAYTATQFALLTSLSAVPRTFCNAATGYIVEFVGWELFFLICTALAVPGMLLLLKVAPYNQKSADSV